MPDSERTCLPNQLEWSDAHVGCCSRRRSRGVETIFEKYVFSAILYITAQETAKIKMDARLKSSTKL